MKIIRELHTKSGSGKEKILLTAIIDEVKEANTRSGKMAFLKLSDESGWIECIVFPSHFSRFRKMLITGKHVEVYGLLNLVETPKKLFLTDIKSSKERRP